MARLQPQEDEALAKSGRAACFILHSPVTNFSYYTSLHKRQTPSRQESRPKCRRIMTKAHTSRGFGKVINLVKKCANQTPWQHLCDDNHAD